MAGVYVIHPDGGTEPMERVRCVNEDRELQLILERNPDLLPGEQIDPEDPRRWLLIKREMPVPDPGTGQVRWSVDFVLADQDAVPTFVECKRFADTRSRREVVGQMFEYAANGHYYWTKDDLRNHADESARRKNQSLEDALTKLHPTGGEDAEAFFDRVQQNLREGQLRIVFFLEESPPELRSVVDFLNKQMERSEVLLVEARQYTRDGVRIVVPTLFGYTEEARQVKRTVTVTSAVSRKKWDHEKFVADAEARLSREDLRAVERLHDECRSLGFAFTWGTGAKTGSFGVKHRELCPRTIFTAYTDGRIMFNMASLTGSEDAVRAHNRLKDLLPTKVGLPLPDDCTTSYPAFWPGEWVGKVDRLLDVVRQLVAEAGLRQPTGTLSPQT